ncbi:type VI secretion system baseplate subunit TssF, partial [Campylobacter jejuni]|nr:type VI secretion system baseplate subunit TssF [Campylobacter jejuni]
LPSMCMQEFKFSENSKLNRLIIPKNSTVKSVSIEKCECEFKTVYDVYLYPLNIENVFLGSERQYHTLDIQLRVSREDLNIEHLGLDKLSIYLGDDVYTSSTLLFYMHQYLEEIKVISHDTKEEFKINTHSIKTMGLKPNESCLFYNDLGFESFSLLREYFFLPEKFNFISIQGLDVLHECKGKLISIFFKFNKTLPKNCIIKNELFSLSTTPIINIFEKTAEPIINNHSKNGYRIFIDRANLNAYDIVQIKQVKAHNSDSGSRILKNYKNFERFEFMQNKIQDFYYITNKSNSKQDNFKEISFFSSNNTNETITIDVLCCNKNLPTHLKIGDINLIPFYKDAITKNITIPTPIKQVKTNGDLLWKLVSILSFSYQTLLTKTSFFQVLESYSFPDDKTSEVVCQLLTSSIIDIQSKPSYLIDEHITKKGTMSIISIDDSKFYSLGEVYKLGL